MNYPNLLSPLKIGSLNLPNRVLMAPLTRVRADANHVPTDLMVEHYGDRASSGLLIAEATAVAEESSAFGDEPGIYNEAQVAGWRKVTERVHENGGRIFLQIWHGGRACHPDFNAGRVPIAPSALPITNDEVHTPEGKKAYTTPRALAGEEIAGVVTSFRKAAENAKAAGFDGVEIHGANGYLLDEFLRSSANERSDQYGGTPENRCRLLLEVTKVVCGVWGSERVGLRVSPLNSFNSMSDDDPVALYRHLAGELNAHQLAYLHVMRADFLQEQEEDVMSPIREVYEGVIVANMGYDAEEAEQAIKDGLLDAVAFGTLYIANPDLVERFQKGASLNEPNPETYYSDGAEGYNDYPKMAENA